MRGRGLEQTEERNTACSFPGCDSMQLPRVWCSTPRTSPPKAAMDTTLHLHVPAPLLPSQEWTEVAQSRAASWYEWITSLQDLNPAFWWPPVTQLTDPISLVAGSCRHSAKSESTFRWSAQPPPPFPWSSSQPSVPLLLKVVLKLWSWCLSLCSLSAWCHHLPLQDAWQETLPSWPCQWPQA